MECILASIRDTEAMARLEKAAGALPCALFGVAEGAAPHVLELLRQSSGRPVFTIYATEREARAAQAAFPYAGSIYLPPPQAEIRAVEAEGREAEMERIAALAKLGSHSMVFLSADALLHRLRPMQPGMDIAAGAVMEPRALLEALAGMGYVRTELVEERGCFSGRGDIVDVFPPDAEHPLRVSFFGDEVESIRRFDESNQRSFGEGLERADICRGREIVLSREDCSLLREYLENPADPRMAEMGARYAMSLAQTGSLPNIAAFTGIFPDPCTVLDYVERPLLCLMDGARIAGACHRRAGERTALLAGVIEEGGAFGCENDCRMDWDAFMDAHAAQTIDFAATEALYKPEIDFGMHSAAGMPGNMELLAQSAKERVQAGWRVYLMAGSRAGRLSRELEEIGLTAPAMPPRPLKAPMAAAVGAHLEKGFELPGAKCLFLGEAELFGGKRRRADAPKKRQVATAADMMAGLKAGDIVVHELHGKGRFLGLKNMEVGGVRADYMEIEYRGGDRLFVQTSQIERVSRYIGPGDGDDMRLSKLGGREWENAKARARSSVKELAEDLLAIYAQRAEARGFAFSEDTVWQKQFEDNFEYEETEGQAAAIAQIKRDMQSQKIMDRLLLGDVGYGKTEVAMRAAFKAVMDSKQVAMLVPTTLLARQHYNTFRERFSGFPVKLAMLSRFAKDTEAVVQGANDGSIDILIGTHKLLSPKLQFKDLGLLIVDEEQRFGVSHKERIKDMRRTVDALTLTATPIPRTLEMAMTGIRDMSIIETPPAARKEVQAFVCAFGWGMVRDAILREMERGGQAYFVCRRVGQMDELLARLREAAPEARVGVAHGQMAEREFERAITQFYEHEFDVLLCTTIIESGIDIPSVNTIIVYEADQFGLAQLYQLKGRVGRSSVRAYAYFTHKEGRELTEVASKRLAAMREFTQLGSGMRIAMRDLEIRGAGNILGAEQSGHMAQIGYELYCRMVREQVSEAMGAPLPQKRETAVELGMSAFIPPEYIGQEAQRMDAYRRIAGAEDLERAKVLRAELMDRYGALPREVENLLTCAVVGAYGRRAQMASIIRKQDVIEMKFAGDAAIDLPRLAQTLLAYRKIAMLRRSNPAAILLKPAKGRAINDMIQLLLQVAGCAE